MKKVFLLLLILLIACSGSEDTADITADTKAETEDVLVPPPAPILENPTENVKLLSRRFLFYEGMRTNTYFGLPGVERLKREKPKLITPEEDTPMVTSAGEPTNVYRVRNGHLTQEEIVSQEPLYHLVWVDLNDEIVLMNVLENRIKYIPYDEAMDQAFDNLTPEQKAREDELWAEYRATWDALPEDIQEKLKTKEGHELWIEIFPEGDPSNQWLREINPQPFDIRHHGRGKLLWGPHSDFGDEIEVVIKYRFTLEVIRRNRAGHPIFESAVDMILVDVKKNISRPHIIYRPAHFQ